MIDVDVLRSRLRRLADWGWPGRPTRWRDVPGAVQPTVLSIVRLTTAAVVSYLLTLVLTEGEIDLTGPLTALLVMQASAFSTLRMSAVRVGAVLSGVLVAILLSTGIGLTWWSLGAAIAAALLIGKVLRLGEQALEAPISAMLILGVSNPDISAEIRVLNTLLGAGVGIAFNLIYPPAMPLRSASQALLRVADAVAAPLEAAGEALGAGPVTRAQVESWQNRTRSATGQVAEAAKVLALLKDSRRLNPRALGTADVEPVLASGLDRLERCLLGSRALFTVIVAEIPNEHRRDDPYGEELRSAFGVVLADVGDCLRAFGNLVIAEAEDREAETEQALAKSLEILRETRAILTELIMVNAQPNTATWLLRGSILSSVDHVLAQLDLEDRARVRQQWREEQLRRPLAQLPPIIAGVMPHPDRPTLRGFPGLRLRRAPPGKDDGRTGASAQPVRDP